jgi:hypothetical protein
MPILSPTPIHGRVTWLGVVRDRAVTLQSEALETMTLDWTGPVGECHGGLTRPSCSRVRLQHPKKGTEIRNTRQLSMLSAEELAGIAADLGMDDLPPSWAGANIVFEGIPQFTTLPPCSRLIFENGTTIAVEMENGPCRYVAEVIEGHRPGHGSAFPRVAAGRRGVTGWVERPGEIALGAVARLHIPPQRIYEPGLRAAAAE